jgi:hypothetical protein
LSIKNVFRSFFGERSRIGWGRCASVAGWSLGCVSAIDSDGRTIWIADAHRDDGKRFVVRADEKLTVYLELESADSIRQNAQRIAEGVK